MKAAVCIPHDKCSIDKYAFMHATRPTIELNTLQKALKQ